MFRKILVGSLLNLLGKRIVQNLRIKSLTVKTMTENKNNNSVGYQLTSQVFLRIFQCSGIWFPDNFSYLYSVYAFMLYIFGSLAYAIFTVVHLSSVESVADTTQSLFMLTIVFSVFSKSTNFMYYNKCIKNLYHRIHNDFDLYSELERNLVATKLRSFLNILIAFVVLCMVCVSTGCISSALRPNKQLPFPTWYPLNWTVDKFSFWLAWSHISLATYLAIGTNAGVQLFTSYLMFFMSVLMEVLGQRLCKLWSTVEKNAEKKCRRIDSDDELIGCIEMHQQILQIIDEYKKCFSLVLLYDICSTALGVCSTVYQLVMLSNRDLTAYMFFVPLLAIQNGQIFLPCYFGNGVILSSAALSEHLFFANWLDMKKESRKTFICLLERLKCESQIVVGKMFPLSLETYTTVCKHAYRLFTLLCSLNG